eukprot:SAG11_NODE_2361_length_3462_cov_2.031519_5_plen_79_part_00
MVLQVSNFRIFCRSLYLYSVLADATINRASGSLVVVNIDRMRVHTERKDLPGASTVLRAVKVPRAPCVHQRVVDKGES